MSAIASAPAIGRTSAGERVSWSRLVWVAPLTLLVAVGVCYGIRWLVQTLAPSVSRMPMLGPSMVTLAVEGSLAAIVVFVLFAQFVPRPIFWYRIVGGIALVLSWAPDIALALGGTPMRLALRYVAPLASIGIGAPGGGGPPTGGPPPGAQTGGPPPGFLSGMSVEQVVVLMLLHTAVALVCVGMLTTLSVQSSPVQKANGE
jgi:hypothetical protein